MILARIESITSVVTCITDSAIHKAKGFSAIHKAKGFSAADRARIPLIIGWTKQHNTDLIIVLKLSNFRLLTSYGRSASCQLKVTFKSEEFPCEVRRSRIHLGTTFLPLLKKSDCRIGTQTSASLDV